MFNINLLIICQGLIQGVIAKSGFKSEESIDKFFGITPNDYPSINIIDNSLGTYQKYRFSDVYKKMNLKNLTKFVDLWQQKKLINYKRSQPIPEYQPPIIKVVVEKNFRNVVINNDNDIVLLVFSPTDQNSKKWAELLENEVVKKLKMNEESNPKLGFAALDIVGNEVDDLNGKVTAVPLIMLFPGKNKNNYKIYKGEQNAESLCDFIVDNSNNSVERDDL